MYSSLQTFVGDWFPILLDAAIKGTAVLLLAGLLLTCMRRASAAARHVVCFSATVSLLLLPLASVVLPGWQILPLPTFEALSPDVPVLADRVASPPAMGVKTARDVVDRPIANSRSLYGKPFFKKRVSRSDRTTPLASEPVVSSEPAVEPLLMCLAGLWALGSLAVFATILVSRLSLFVLERRTKRIVDGPWLELLKQTAGTLNIRRSVALLQTDGDSMPLAAGLLRSRIILPADFSSWSHQRRRVVMLHEMGHIRRRDCLTKMIAQTACALYWFNPLVWVALKWVRIEAEQACDDLVLSSGSDPCDYAEHLLQITSGRQANRLAACSAIAMARPSRLESRLRAILDPHRRRRLTRLGALVLTATVIGTAALIGCTKTAGPEPNGPEQADPRVSDADAANALPIPPVSGPEGGESGSMASVVIEAEIVGEHGGSKYYWYDIKPTRVIKNTIEARLDSPMMVAIQNDMPEIEVGKKYTLNLAYYNPTNPEYGLRIVSFKEK